MNKCETIYGFGGDGFCGCLAGTNKGLRDASASENTCVGDLFSIRYGASGSLSSFEDKDLREAHSDAAKRTAPH